MIIFLLFILAFSGQGLRAESLAAQKLPLKEVLETALAKNPEIEALRKNLQASGARISSESGYDRTKIFYESMYSGRERTVGISQDIPFPGKLSLRGAIARRESDMAEQELKAKELEVTAKVRSAYAMLYLSRKYIEIYEENADLVRRFAKVAESKYSVGKASQLDVLKAQVELSKISNTLVTLEQERDTAQAALNVLLNQDPDQPIGLPNEPKVQNLELDYRQLSQAAMANRPELLENRHHVRHSKAVTRSARFDFLPDFMVQARRRSADNPEMDGSSDLMVGASVPLWFAKPGAAAKAARLEEEKSEAEYQTMKNMTLWSLKDLLVKVKAARRLVELYRTSVIPQAENALNVAQSAYRSDRGTFLDLIDIQRNLLQFRLEHYQHLAEYEISLAELERIVGKPLSEVSP